MKNPRTFRSLARSLLGVALTSATAFAISPDDLSALRAKAETGDGIAQHNLGLVYANLQEPVSDLVEAYAWLNIAADNGATGRSLLMVTRQMTAAQIADGKRRLEQIRAAIASKKAVPPSEFTASAPVSPVADSPVSASPISPVAVPSAEADAREAELKKISAELADAWKENDQLKTAVTKAEQDAAAAIAALKAERDKLSQSLENSTREIAGMKAAAANFEGERNGLLQKIAAAQEASDGELRLKVVALENDLTTARAAAKELDAAKQSLASLGDQQQKLTAENQRLASLVKQAETATAEQTAAAEKDLAALRAELAAVQAQQADAATKLAAGEKVAAELAGLKDRMAASQQALAVATAEVAGLKQELQDAKTGVVPVEQHRELQARLESHAAEQQKQAAETLKKAQDDAEAEKSRLSAELAALTAATTEEIAGLKAGAANFEGERNGLLKKIEDTERSLAAATAEAAALQEKLATTQNEMVPAQQHKELEARLAAATTAAEEQQKAQEELRKSLAALEAEKSALTEKLGALDESSTRELATLRAGAANFEGERNGLQEKIIELERSLTQATTEAATAKEQLAAARAASEESSKTAVALARVTQELDTLKKTSSASSQAIADARAEVVDLRQQLAEAKTGVVPAVQLQELQAQLAAAVKAQEEQKEAQAGLEKSVAALEAERNSLAEKLAAATSASESEAAGLKAASANFEGERNGLLQKIADAEQAAARAAAENAGLKEQLAAAAKSGEAPAQEVREMQAKLDAAIAAQETQQQQQAALQQANAALEAESARLGRELAVAQTAAREAAGGAAAVEDLQARLKAAEEASAAIRAERETLAQRVAVLEQEKAAPAAPVPAGEDPVELRKQLDEASARLTATLRSFQLKEEEVDSLQKSLVATDSERAALAERIQAAEKQATDARAASVAGQEASAQLAALREQLRHAQNQVGQLAAENIQLKNRTAPVAVTTATASTGPVLSPPRRPADTASPTSTVVRAPQAAEPRIHTVVEGETLTRIARRYYGNSERWADIYDANRASLPNPAALKIGMKLRIP